MKLIRNLGITIIVLILLYLLLRQFNLIPDIKNWFISKPIQIENTPLIVQKIKELKQLITITSYDEVVMNKQTDVGGTLLGNIIANGPINPNTKRIGLIAKGSIYAGIDLQLLQEKDIVLLKDSIAIHLPQAIIIDAIVNPSDTDIFIEQGQWDMLEINKIKVEARTLMIERAKEKKILDKANFRGKLIIENFLRTIGFRKISVTTTIKN